MAYGRRRTRGGEELIEFMLAVLHRTGEFEDARITLRERVEAATWLRDTLFGRPAPADEDDQLGGRVPPTVIIQPLLRVIEAPAPTAVRVLEGQVIEHGRR